MKFRFCRGILDISGQELLSDFYPSTALDLEVLAQPEKTSLLLDHLLFPKDLGTRGLIVILGTKQLTQSIFGRSMFQPLQGPPSAVFRLIQFAN